MNYHLDNSTKIILRVVVILLALGFLWLIRDIVIVVLLALVLASALEPMADYLNRFKIPRFVSVLGTYVIVIGIFGLMISLLAPLVIDQAQVLSENLPTYAVELQARYPNLTVFFGGTDLATIAQKLVTSNTGSDIIFDRTLGLFNGLVALVTVLVISFYLVAADRGMKKFIGDLVPSQYQSTTIRLIEKIQRKMGLWVVGQVILSVFIFVLTYVGLSILGVDYALVLATMAGLLEVVPYIGPFVAAVPAVFFALIQSPPLVIGVIILYIVIQKTEGYVLVPKVMEKTVGTSPLVVLLSLLIGYKLAGILGILLAVPLAGAITVVIQEFFQEKPVQPDV
jgi:predicted PurR-regulated permease PerM